MTEVMIFARPEEDPVMILEERNVRINYNNQWIDFLDGEILVTPEKRQLNTEKPFGGFV